MSNSKHTPGPWHVDGDMIRNKPNHHYSHSKWIARLIPRGEGVARSESEDAANARLIAAAPEMYDALRNALDVLGMNEYERESCRRRIRDVLAKAGAL